MREEIGRFGDAAGEVASARLVLAGGDLRHAAGHLADALALDPRWPDTHEALAEFAAAAGGAEQALGFFDLNPGETFIGTVAARAHLCAAASRWDEAVRVLLSVAAHEPDRPWLDVAWLHRSDLGELVDPDVIAIPVARLAQGLADPVDEVDRPPLLPALELLRASVARNPGHAVLLWCGSMLARRLGACEEAVVWARRSFAVRPSHQAAVMEGYALRTAGRSEEALEVWAREVEREPGELALCVDVADLLESMDRPAEALVWAQRVVDADPGHPRGVPTALGLRFVVEEDVRHLVALSDHVRAHPDHGYAAEVLARHCGGRSWLGRVPDPVEAVVKVLHGVLCDGDPGEPLVKVSSSALEPASATVALRSVFPAVAVWVAGVPEPDLRVPVRPVRHAVWRYEGTEAVPAVARPSAEAAEAVRRVAGFHWASLPAAYDRAVVLSGLSAADLLGVLAFPPSPPDDELGRVLARRAPQLWVRSAQVWACLGLAHHRADEPWGRSLRREILADLVAGPEDWVVEAAGAALCATAWVRPETRADVRSLVVGRLRAAGEAYRLREVTILGSLCELVLALPGVEESSAAVARELLAAFSTART
ncbi:hypothetical protein [Actinosynnema sp. NPDC020468]|uniref:hypothetical protein n=1 Tax=Actinosynnema sp. NPDC020468 TaxID=3154488 RepID=UPI0033EF5460